MNYFWKIYYIDKCTETVYTKYIQTKRRVMYAGKSKRMGK